MGEEVRIAVVVRSDRSLQGVIGAELSVCVQSVPIFKYSIHALAFVYKKHKHMFAYVF